MGRFDNLMEHLNPKMIIEKTQTPHDNARAGVTLQSSIVGSYPEFESLLIAYVHHHMEQTWGGAPPPDMCLDRARMFLDKSMGYDNAVFIAMSGADGGIHYVLNEISNGFKEEAKRAYFTYIVDSFIEPMSFEETVEVMREFKERVGTYSPASFGYISPEQMAAKYKEILWSYIDSLSNYRNLWNY